MKKCLMISLCLILILWTASAMASFNHYTFDVDALKAIEQTDTFAVRITRKTVTDKATGGDLHNQDVLSFEVTNNSNSGISGIVIACVAYDANNTAQSLRSEGLSAISMGNTARCLTEITFTPENASAGAVFTLNQSCCHSNFTGVRAIVKEYTTESGEVVANPLFTAWKEEALGRPTHILD